jgi:hypothetical protein
MWVLASGVVDSRVEEVHGHLPKVIVIADMVKVGPTCKCAATRMDFRGRKRWWLIVLVWYCPWITVLGAKHYELRRSVMVYRVWPRGQKYFTRRHSHNLRQ